MNGCIASPSNMLEGLVPSVRRPEHFDHVQACRPASGRQSRIRGAHVSRKTHRTLTQARTQGSGRPVSRPHGHSGGDPLRGQRACGRRLRRLEDGSRKRADARAGKGRVDGLAERHEVRRQPRTGHRGHGRGPAARGRLRRRLRDMVVRARPEPDRVERPPRRGRGRDVPGVRHLHRGGHRNLGDGG